MATGLEVVNNVEGSHGASGFSPSGCDPNQQRGKGKDRGQATCVVRYGYMRYVGEFKYAPGTLSACGGKVVIQSRRGIEIGEQISLTCSGCNRSVDRKQMVDYARRGGQEFMQPRAGKILRQATEQDIAEAAHLNSDESEKLKQARTLAAEMNLEMRFVTCEHLLGGERIIFHFMSEGRVDFRELVRQLAQEYHTRIEMHQVGSRDEARLVADYEICGRECCCKNFLKKLRQVNMKMAKLQKATLDPSKVSGRCGRLRCCLRYEHEGYEELSKTLPKAGARIRTEAGIATVKNRQILTQLLNVQYDDSREFITIGVEEIIERGLPRRDLAAEQKREAGQRGRWRSAPEVKERPQEGKSRRSRRGKSRPRDPERQAEAASPPASTGTPPAETPDQATGDNANAQRPGDGESPRPKRRRRRRGRRRRDEGTEGGASQTPGTADGSSRQDKPPPPAAEG